jgi:UDP-4-amino-4,6-dideoxy-N-acetyl-beta-L-altrosamine N-acetyltransferase
MSEQDLSLVLAWRNHPDIRSLMRSQAVISNEEHLAWFARTSGDSSVHLLIFEVDDRPLGFAKLSLIEGSPVAEWGFYAAPDAPRGTGVQLGVAVLNFAFNELGLHKVCGQVLAFNERSLRFHRKLGFRDEGILRDQYFDGVGYHAVFCFGMMASEWNARMDIR